MQKMRNQPKFQAQQLNNIDTNTTKATMQSMESSFQVACDDGNIPGAVLVATNRDGSFDYAKAFGFRSLEGDVKPRCEVDTIMGLFSATKFVTTIAALQLVEQGLVSLDNDTSDLLPELARLPILASMEGGKAELRTRRNPITLRYYTRPGSYSKPSHDS